MVELLLVASLVLLLCIFSGKFLYRYGVPLLLVFMVLGMVFGSDGIVGIAFDDYQLAKEICAIGLVFIMFYGGMGTNWKIAKPIAGPAIALSTLGVVITAFLVAFFCEKVMGISFLEGLLIGSAVSSTDAASVFSILKSRKLNLKHNLASLLEIESGSNDPFAFMLTSIVVGLLGTGQSGSIFMIIVKQIGIGAGIGMAVAFLGLYVMRRIVFEIEGLYPIFITSATLLVYSLSEFYGGNGYLGVYLLGLILGNSKMVHKRSLIHFFDGISWLMQIMLFFSLGLLSFPSQLPNVAGMGIGIAVFLTFVARPLAVFLVLTPFRIPIRQQLLVSWVGLRGAASLVFAIYALAANVGIGLDLFHIVFFVALLSVSVQGSLLARVAKKLKLVDEGEENQVLKTFNDYRDEDMLSRITELKIDENHPWVNKLLIDAEIPQTILILMIKRGKEFILPKGLVEIQSEDILILCGNQLERDLREIIEKPVTD